VLWETAMLLPEGCLIVELGVCHGRTAVLLASVAQEKQGCYYGIDTWALEGSRAAVAEAFERRFSRETWWSLWEGRTQEAPIPLPIHFLLIDAGHDEANVKPDCARWIPHVLPGGYVAFHDYDAIPDPQSPHWAVRCYADRHTGSWPSVAQCGGLMIRRRPL